MNKHCSINVRVSHPASSLLEGTAEGQRNTMILGMEEKFLGEKVHKCPSLLNQKGKN